MVSHLPAQTTLLQIRHLVLARQVGHEHRPLPTDKLDLEFRIMGQGVELH